MIPVDLLAHGIGGRTDLPLPAWMFRYGAGAAVCASFLALAVLWPTSRLEGGTGELTLARTRNLVVRVLTGLARLFGLVAFAVVLASAALGPRSALSNLAPVSVYVTLWVGLAFLSGFVGDLWRVLSPYDTLAALGQHRRSVLGLSDRLAARGRRLRPGGRRRSDGEAEAEQDQADEADEADDADDKADDEAEDTADGEDEEDDGEEHERGGAGCWPAAAGLLAFVWVELVYPDRTEPRTLLVLMVAYSLVVIAGAAAWGRGWLRRGEAFAAFFGVLGHVAPVHRDDQGRLRLRPPFAGLATLRPRPGLEAIVMIALGSTAFDGVTRTQFWGDTTQDITGASKVLVDSAGLLWCIATVAIAYIVAMRVGAGLVGYERSPEQLRGDFLHSLVPIILAYAVAHYFSLLVLEGQATIALVSDPFGRGWDLFGTATRTVNFNLVSPRAIALVQSGAIVVGHIAGVVVAHDRALALFGPIDRPEVVADDGTGRRAAPRRLAVRASGWDSRATRSQYPLLAVMVLFTVGGLFLLLGG